MAYKLIDREYNPHDDASKHSFMCDTDADFANLPECCTGSVAVSAATCNVYVVNASGNWVPFGGE